MRSTSEKFYVFNTRDEIYLVFTEEKLNFLFILCELSKNHAKSWFKINFFHSHFVYVTSLVRNGAWISGMLLFTSVPSFKIFDLSIILSQIFEFVLQ